MVDKTARFFIVILSLFSIWVVISNFRNVREISAQNKKNTDSFLSATPSQVILSTI